MQVVLSFKVPVVRRQSYPTVDDRRENSRDPTVAVLVEAGRCPCGGRSCVVPWCRSWSRRVSHSCTVKKLVEIPVRVCVETVRKTALFRTVPRQVVTVLQAVAACGE